MRITRRHLLALAAGTTAAAALTGGAVVASWWDAPADAPFSVLTTEEAAFLRAWSGVAFPATPTLPLAGEDAGLDRFFAAMLRHTPADAARLLRLLVNALDGATVISHGSSFTSLEPAEQATVFEDWTHSGVAHFRSATQSLVLLLGMGWSTHPEIAPHMRLLHSCGYGQ